MVERGRTGDIVAEEAEGTAESTERRRSKVMSLRKGRIGDFEGTLICRRTAREDLTEDRQMLAGRRIKARNRVNSIGLRLIACDDLVKEAESMKL